MTTIRGFVTQSSYINNVPGTVAEFFELSPIALTYSRTRGEYQLDVYPGFTFQSFKAVSNDNKDIVVSDAQNQEIFDVVKAVLAYMSTAVYPYDINELQQSIQAQFSSRIKSFIPGELFVGTKITLPTYLQWVGKSDTVFDADVKIWLRNEMFETQYSEFDLVVVPPIDSLDLFFGTYGDLATKLAAMTISDSFDRIEQFKDGNPETFVWAHSYDFVNRNNVAQKTPTPWCVIGYGQNGNNTDAIKNALVAYCLANSAHDQPAWEAIFPSLFQRTEFLFCPRWDLISIENLTTTAALYSSTIDPIEAVKFAKKFWPNEAESWIESNLTLLPFDYKCLSVIGLNGSSNSADAQSLTKLFPDYLPVSTSSVDFNRMTIKTREWVLMMVKLLKVAETADAYTTLEAPMRRITRNNIIYVSQMYEDVNYLVATAKSVGAVA